MNTKLIILLNQIEFRSLITSQYIEMGIFVIKGILGISIDSFMIHYY